MTQLLRLKAPYIGIKLDQVREYIPKIISLTNAVHFRLNYAIIINIYHVEPQCPPALLLVKGGGKILTDAYYDNIKGAKIAFHKVHRLKALHENVKPIWSMPYEPSVQWLDKKLAEILNKEIS